MQKQPVIRWGIIGCGDVTEVKSGPAFQKVERSELVAVMRRNGPLARDYAERHGVGRWYSDAGKLINDPEVDAVYVATPPGSHAKLSIMAMKAGKPVYVEKPMAVNYGECLEMVAASEKYGVPLFVAYYRRALPGFLKVKELVDSGTIGDVRMVNIQLYKPVIEADLSETKPWRVDPSIAGGGYFVDLASHQLDYLDYLFGPVKETISVVKNQAGLYSAEDAVSASFLFEQQVIVTGNWCFTVPEFLDRDTIEIIGNEGSIVFSCFDFKPVELRTKGQVKKFEFPKPAHVQEPLVRKVVGHLLGTDTSPSMGISAMRTTRVMDRVLEQYYRRLS